MRTPLLFALWPVRYALILDKGYGRIELGEWRKLGKPIPLSLAPAV